MNTNEKIAIADLKINQKIQGVPFALNEMEVKYSRQEKPYYNIKISDKSGELRGKVWTENMQNCDQDLKIGDIVRVSGLIQEYAGKPQIIIDSMSNCTDMAPEEFLPVTSRNRDEMVNDMQMGIEQTSNEHFKTLLNLFWDNPDMKNKYINYPAGEYVHHGYVGGLLEHTWEMWQMAQSFLKIYPQLDRDLLFTGLFFHDIGKLEELDIVGATIVRTNAGRLVAHIGQGLLYVENLVKQIDDFPEELKEKLYHLILSHQGELEYGSPIRPQMLEALVLSMVDSNGAYMNQATKHIEKNLQSGEDFTDYHKWLGRSFYQKDYLSEIEE